MTRDLKAALAASTRLASISIIISAASATLWLL
jgi:hypothetical protein